MMPEQGGGDLKAERADKKFPSGLMIPSGTQKKHSSPEHLSLPRTVLLFPFLLIPQKPTPCEVKTLYFLAQDHLTLSPTGIKTHN